MTSRHLIAASLLTLGAFPGPASARPFCTNPPFVPFFPLSAQRGSEVFEKSFDVEPGQPACFKLTAPGAQRLHVTLGSPHGTGYFHIYPQGWVITQRGSDFSFGEPGLPGASDGDRPKSWTGQVPDGNSLIVVYIPQGRQYRIHIEAD